MNRFPLAFITVIAVLSSCVNGIEDNIYVAGNGFSGYELILEEESFMYEHWSCTGGTKGTGKWAIKNDSIELIFENQIDLSKIHIVNTSPSINDSIFVSFQTLDEFEIPVFQWVYLLEKTNSTSRKTIDSVFTDFDGYGRFNLKKSNREYELLFIQYPRTKLYHRFISNKNQIIKASIYSGFISILSDTVLKYHYKTNNNMITLSGPFENGHAKEIVFKKITKNYRQHWL